MFRPLESMAVLALAIPLVAQQPPQTTTSVNTGDPSTSITGSATAQQQQPPSGTIRQPATPRAPGSAVAPRASSPTARTARQPVGRSARDRAAAAGNPDVLLEVPNLR